MKVLFALALVVGCAVAVEYTVETCKCGEQFTARPHAGGKVQCVGNQLLIVLPCNLPEAPRCVCETDAVTGIMTDAEGTWCTRSERGVQKKKWPCENAEAWAAYKVELEKYNQSLKE